MKKRMMLILIVVSISFLTSCATNGIILPKTKQGDVKTYTVNEQGTVEIIGQDMLIEPTHWLFVECDHWSGCYMRCQGQIKSCKKVATDSELEIDHISTSH